MANSIIPIVAVGALLLLSGKKSKKKSSSAKYNSDEYTPYDENFVIPDTSGPKDESASSAVWISRQKALATLANAKVCSCNPGSIDGKYGPSTKSAVIAFQSCANLATDGLWGPATESAMQSALAALAKGAKGSSEKLPPLQTVLEWIVPLGYNPNTAISEFSKDWNTVRSYIKSGPHFIKFVNINIPGSTGGGSKITATLANAALFVRSEVIPKRFPEWGNLVIEARNWSGE